MNPYGLALFLHVVGDIGIFIGMGVQLLTLAVLRRAERTEQVRALAGLLALTNPLGLISALVTIAAGLYMALSAWGLHTGWISVTLGSIIVLLPPLIGGVIEPRMLAIVKVAIEAPDGPLPESLESRIHDWVLGTALQTGAAIVLGIVFLMTLKPSLGGSVATMLIALVLGLISGLPLWLRPRQKSRINL